ncbi:MAG: hypothetical protein RLZZ618_1493 [Pseudomonadota bacterium]|jgi:nicotinamide riboside kinase
MAQVVALLGAESTGKTTLAAEIGQALRAEGHDVAVVPEFLREFCDQHGRTPRVDEQAGIAAEQSRRIQEAAASHALVIADTSALMIAVYSDWVFGDPSLYDSALLTHATYDLTLLTALDLPWQADGLMRDGPQVREPVDQRVRAALARGGLGYSVVGGTGVARLNVALAAVRHLLGRASVDDDAARNPRWQWQCDRCSDGDCERHLFKLN